MISAKEALRAIIAGFEGRPDALRTFVESLCVSQILVDDNYINKIKAGKRFITLVPGNFVRANLNNDLERPFLLTENRLVVVVYSTLYVLCLTYEDAGILMFEFAAQLKTGHFVESGAWPLPRLAATNLKMRANNTVISNQNGDANRPFIFGNKEILCQALAQPALRHSFDALVAAEYFPIDYGTDNLPTSPKMDSDRLHVVRPPPPSENSRLAAAECTYIAGHVYTLYQQFVQNVLNWAHLPTGRRPSTESASLSEIRSKSIMHSSIGSLEFLERQHLDLGDILALTDQQLPIAQVQAGVDVQMGGQHQDMGLIDSARMIDDVSERHAVPGYDSAREIADLVFANVAAKASTVLINPSYTWQPCEEDLLPLEEGLFPPEEDLLPLAPSFGGVPQFGNYPASLAPSFGGVPQFGNYPASLAPSFGGVPQFGNYPAPTLPTTPFLRFEQNRGTVDHPPIMCLLVPPVDTWMSDEQTSDSNVTPVREDPRMS